VLHFASWWPITTFSQSYLFLTAANYFFAIYCWGQYARSPGCFMSFFANATQKSHLVGAPIHNSPLNEVVNVGSPPDVELVHGNDNAKIEKRIMWNVDEEVN
jgi:hypothetical protein